jgi:hypothetical protein
MAFVEYRGQGLSKGKRITLALTQGRGTLSRQAVTILGEPSHVVLLWDADTRTVGLRPASNAEPHAVKLSTRSWQVSMVAFCTHFGITIGPKVIIDGTAGDGLVVFPLDSAVSP